MDRIRAVTAVRVMATATAAYSTAIAVRPALLAGPSRELDAAGRVPATIATLTRSTGTRDVLLALLLATSRPGRQMRTMSVARAVADGADAVWFARSTPAGQRWKVSGAAALWSATELTLGLLASRGA